jgi:ATP-dependent Clp protease protease subunit
MATPELLIDGTIGYDWWTDGGITGKWVNAFLREHAKAKEILVRINSPGGDVFEGQAIYTALKKCDANIIVEVESLAASAASYIAMAGDEIRIHKGAMFMIHEASGGCRGRAADMTKTAELLTIINGEIADLYAARTGQQRDALLKMMDDETWMPAEKAKELGFCDKIIPAKAQPTRAPDKNKAAARNALLASFKNTPKALLGQQPPLTGGMFANVVRSPLSELASVTARLGSR